MEEKSTPTKGHCTGFCKLIKTKLHSPLVLTTKSFVQHTENGNSPYALRRSYRSKNCFKRSTDNETFSSGRYFFISCFFGVINGEVVFNFSIERNNGKLTVEDKRQSAKRPPHRLFWPREQN